MDFGRTFSSEVFAVESLARPSPRGDWEWVGESVLGDATSWTKVGTAQGGGDLGWLSVGSVGEAFVQDLES